MNRAYRILSLTVALVLAAAGAQADTGDYRNLGYLYLSPLPGAEYTSPQTRFVLVRFKDIAPSAVTNLSSCIRVIGTLSGSHSGQTRIASDNRTVLFQMSTDFSANEQVTVALTPGVAGGTVQPYQYQFTVSGHTPDAGIVRARGENAPTEAKEKAFDGNSSTKWVDFIVPNGTTNFSWIQYVYPGSEAHVVNQYAITSASDAPERDPKDWRFYGVDGGGNLILLTTQTGQVFANRLQKNTYSFANTVAYRGYRLEITQVNNPSTATGVQLAELGLIASTGTILREYWTGIAGSAVSDLTGNAAYPNSPTARDALSSFQTPTDWADSYGTRVRGYITAPVTGSYVFWISSDDNGELWLSPSADPAGAQRIASVSSWTSSLEWNKLSEQKSAAINLVAGQKYYVQALQKEAAGGDNLAVGWAKPGQDTSAPSEVIPGEVLSPWVLTGLAAAPQASAVLKSSVTPLVQALSSTSGQVSIMPNGVSVPADFPRINITTSNNPDSGYIFIDNRGGGGKPYNVIFDNAGSPIWYMRMPDERRDMKVQHNGMLTMLARTGGMRFVGLNTNYTEVASYWAVNGYDVDEHELQVLADGTYFLVGLRSQTLDMSRYVTGGNTSASVTEQVIQQFTAAGDLIFQWRAWDHIDITDEAAFIDLKGGGFDFPHMNAIDVDTDGHILLSCRNTSAITKINRDTGEIIWRLGGAHNGFAFVNDPLYGPRNQHAIRCVGTNHYTLFDNGNLHTPSVSRALEYVLDPVAMTATIVWQYPTVPTTSFYSFYMGNAQRLPNGNTLINWAIGSLPKLTEVRPDGTKAFEMNWVDQWEAYRVWRCPWQGAARQPYLILEPYPDNVSLIFNQFGDTNVSYYRIYGGTSPNSTTLLATSTTTTKRLTTLQNGLVYYFRVTAVNKNGVEGPFSNEESLTVNILKPGQNMVPNGDFSQGTNSWTWAVSGGAAATWRITNGATRFDITAGGSAISSVQLRMAGIPLILGSKYVFEFDAWSDSPRYIEAKVGQDVSPNANYSGIGNSYVTPVKTHFRYVFTMQAASDFSSRVVFNTGTSTADVYIDNVSLFTPAPGDFNMDGRVDLLDVAVMSGEWLKQKTNLVSELDGDGKVDFNDFRILGENWSATP